MSRNLNQKLRLIWKKKIKNCGSSGKINELQLSKHGGILQGGKDP